MKITDEQVKQVLHVFLRGEDWYPGDLYDMRIALEVTFPDTIDKAAGTADYQTAQSMLAKKRKSQRVGELTPKRK